MNPRLRRGIDRFGRGVVHLAMLLFDRVSSLVIVAASFASVLWLTGSWFQSKLLIDIAFWCAIPLAVIVLVQGTFYFVSSLVRRFFSEFQHKRSLPGWQERSMAELNESMDWLSPETRKELEAVHSGTESRP